MRLVSVLALTAALGLAACQPAALDDTTVSDEVAASADAAPDAAEDDAQPVQADTGVAVSADGEGLRLVNTESGSTRLLAFGSPRGQAVTAIDAAVGASGQSETMGECPSGEFAGPIEYVHYDNAGLTLIIHGGQFVGWTANAATISTMDGVAAGSSYADVQASNGSEATESTLGYEGSIGDIGYLLEGQGGAVSTLFAGSTCFAR